MAEHELETAIRSLHALLKPVQKKMFAAFFSSTGRKFVIHSSRRLGKTFFLVVISCLTALMRDNSHVRYASISQKAVRKMIHPIFKEVLLALPRPLRARWNGQEGAYIFPNGSMIHVVGVNNGHADDARGTAADLAVIDEAAFVDELSYLVESVLMPQLISTGGKLVMASSSPLSPAHDFVHYIQDCKLAGNYSSFQIDQGGYPEDIVAEFCREAGGAQTTTWRREYLNEVIVDTEMAVIPEWKESFVVAREPSELDRFWHRYTAMDIGVRDKTVVLWGYYDFKQAKLIIEDEFSISGPETTTKNIAANVKRVEAGGMYSSVYRRIADNNNLILLQDLSSEFDLHFAPTNKESLAAMVNDVRLLVGAGQLEVHPRCEELIGCLSYGVYQDVKRKEFGRSKAFGHFDALAALVYLVRNLDRVTNPVPPLYGIDLATTYIEDRNPLSEQHKQLRKIFNI